MRVRTQVSILGGIVAAVALGCSSRSANVIVEYDTKPDRPEVFMSGGRPVRVCIGDVDVGWKKGHGGGALGMGEFRITYASLYGGGTVTGEYSAGYTHQVREQSAQWNQYVRGRLAAEIQQRAARSGVQVEVVSRDQKDMNSYFDESVLRDAGLTDAPARSRPARIMGYDLLIAGTIEATTVTDQELKSPNLGVRIGGAAASRVPYVGWLVGNEISRPKMEVRRTITLGGNLRALDGNTQQVFVTEDIAHQLTQECRSFSDESEMDLRPLDQEFKLAFDGAIRRFVDRMLPGHHSETVPVRVRGDEETTYGVTLLASGDANSAVACFRKRLAAKPDDARVQHATGVAHEKLGQLSLASEHYALAIGAMGRTDDENAAQYQLDKRRADHRMRVGATSVAPPTNAIVAGSVASR